jgi:hypothetical protein
MALRIVSSLRMQAVRGPPFWLFPLAAGAGRTRGSPKVKNPALPGGAFVNQEGTFLRFATGCHSSRSSERGILADLRE